LQTNGRSTALWQNEVLAPSAAAGVIYALDRGTGAVQWTLPGVGTYPPQFNSHPATQDIRVVTVSGSTLYAISTSCWLVAYDLSTHAELWRVASPAGAATAERIFSDGNTVYGLYGNGQLIAFSATAPSIRWLAGTSALPFNGPVTLGADRVFATGASGFFALSK
jgi:outer membrane protein assembly factor BamB